MGLETFETGATRDQDITKLDYEGFLSPVVLERFAQYMHQCRYLPDGSLRESDNWQKGIPQKRYMKSLIRHTVELWRCWRKTETVDETVACAVMFNVMGLLHEELRKLKCS